MIAIAFLLDHFDHQFKKMSNPNQDFKSILSQESFDFPLPPLDNVNSTGNSNSHLHTPCSSCGCSNKRHSPDSPVLPAENPKKYYLQPQQNTTPTLPDFSKFTLASTDSTQDNRIPSPSSPPILRRCLSDPCKPPLSSGNQIPITQSPTESGCLTTPAWKGTASMPPRPPIQRCLSDFLRDKSFSQTSSAKDKTVDGNSDSQFVRRMRGCINQCLDEMMAEHKGEKEYKCTEDDSIDTEEASLVTDSEETVSVERSGDCFIVHFKCSCSKGFDILLRGGDFYYKLL